MIQKKMGETAVRKVLYNSRKYQENTYVYLTWEATEKIAALQKAALQNAALKNAAAKAEQD